MSNALIQIPVGVVVTRRKAASQWIDYTWQPSSVLIGLSEAEPWTLLTDDGEAATFYAGSTVLELHRQETANYRENLAGDLSLWVVLQPTGSEPPYKLVKVTVDPSEGEANTEAGAQIVEMVPMPESIRDVVADFVAEHHVEQVFFKRQRTKAEPEAMARRSPIQDKSRD